MKLSSKEKLQIKNYLIGKTIAKDKFLITLLMVLKEDPSLIQKILKLL